MTEFAASEAEKHADNLAKNARPTAQELSESIEGTADTLAKGMLLLHSTVIAQQSHNCRSTWHWWSLIKACLAFVICITCFTSYHLEGLDLVLHTGGQ